MSIKGVARPGGYALPKAKRSTGYRAQSADKDAVSRDVFSDNALEHACSDGVLEFRGNTKLAPDWPGMLNDIVRGARIVR